MFSRLLVAANPNFLRDWVNQMVSLVKSKKMFWYMKTFWFGKGKSLGASLRVYILR